MQWFGWIVAGTWGSSLLFLLFLLRSELRVLKLSELDDSLTLRNAPTKPIENNGVSRVQDAPGEPFNLGSTSTPHETGMVSGE